MKLTQAEQNVANILVGVAGPGGAVAVNGKMVHGKFSEEGERVYAAFREFKALPVDATEADVDAIVSKYGLKQRLAD